MENDFISTICVGALAGLSVFVAWVLCDAMYVMATGSIGIFFNIG